MKLGFKAMNGSLLVAHALSYDISEAQTNGVVYVYIDKVHKDWFLQNILTNRTVTILTYGDDETTQHLAYVPEIFESSDSEILLIKLEKGTIQ